MKEHLTGCRFTDDEDVIQWQMAGWKAITTFSTTKSVLCMKG